MRYARANAVELDAIKNRARDDPKHEEQKLRNLYNRRSRWLTRNWGTSWNGNPTLTFTNEGCEIRVTVFPDKRDVAAYCYVIAIDGTTDFSPHNYPSCDEAKLAAFDFLASELWSH